MGSIIIKFILRNPKWIWNLIKSVLSQFSITPCKYILISLIATIFILIAYVAIIAKPLIYTHANRYFNASNSSKSIEKLMNRSINACGDGSTFARAVIGKKFNEELKTSLEIDIVRSCDKSKTRYRKNGDCGIDAYWVNGFYQNTHYLEDSTIAFINQDDFQLGDRHFNFKEGEPIWLNLVDVDDRDTIEGLNLKIIAPEIHRILSRMQKSIYGIGFVKVRDPIFKDVVYIFTLSFWVNDNESFKRKCADKTLILKRIANKQMQSLLR